MLRKKLAWNKPIKRHLLGSLINILYFTDITIVETDYSWWIEHNHHKLLINQEYYHDNLNIARSTTKNLPVTHT